MEKESKELMRSESGRMMHPLWDMERWLERNFMRPLSLFHPMMTRSLTEELMPPVDILEENSEVVIRMEVPGVKKEDIDVTLTGNTITISGERKTDKEVKRKDYYLAEHSYGSFCRYFGLPSEVQADRVKSTMKDGILEVRLPKTEEAKKKEIHVKVQ